MTFDRQETIRTPILYREGEIEETRAAGEGDRTVRVAFSSETPVARWFGSEILDHKRSSIRLDFFQSGRAPLLNEHKTDNQIGVIKSATVGNDKMGRATVRFAQDPASDTELQRVRDGIRQNVSVGYRVHRMVREDVNSDGGADVYRVVDWEPIEISLVSIPADQAVGVGREAELAFARTGKETFFETVIETKTSSRSIKEALMPEVQTNPLQKRPPIDPKTDWMQTKADEDAEIDALGERLEPQVPGARAMAARYIAEDRGLKAYKERMLALLPQQGPLSWVPPEAREHQSMISKFSIGRALLAHESHDWSNAGSERELIQETVRLNRSLPETAGIRIPAEVLQRATLTTTSEPELLGTQHRPDLFIGPLTNAARVRELGATVLPDLVQDQSIPRETAGVTAEGVAEGSAATQSEPTYDAITLSPKQVATNSKYTLKMLRQSLPVVDMLLRQSIRTQIGLKIDLWALNGSGTGNDPTGILNQTGINIVSMGSPDGGAPTWDKVVEFQTDVAVANADMGRLAWLANALSKSKLMRTVKVSGFPEYILSEPGNSLLGAPFAVSNQLPSNLTEGAGINLSTMIFGNWADLFIGEWGVLDVLTQTDPATGTTTIGAHAFIDVAVRHPESFTACKDMITT